MAVLWISTSTWKRAAFRTVTVAGCYPGCYVRITVSGEFFDHTLAMMRTFTPAGMKALTAQTPVCDYCAGFARPAALSGVTARHRVGPIRSIECQLAENWPLI
jgi:hypothetical protein